MAIIVLASASGAPGVTATAVGLSLVWSGDVLLADCDGHPAQSVLAGYLRGVDAGGHGLPSLARAHREGLPLHEMLLGETIPLSVGEPQRLFLPGFAHAAAPALFEPVWSHLVDAFAAISASGFDVVVDAGRLGVAGLPPALASRADVVLVVCRTNLPALSGLRLHLPSLTESMEKIRGAAPVGLLLVGDGQPYSAEEIEGQFRVPVWGSIVEDARGAAVFGEGEPTSSRFSSTPLVRSLTSAVSGIRKRIGEQRRRIEGAA